MHYCHFNTHTPIGILKLIASENALRAILWDNQDFLLYKDVQKIQPDNHAMLSQATNQLSEYFSGNRNEFNLALEPQGTTFQQQVWQALLKIPHGKTVSYLDIAIAIDNPKGVRAVGMAIGKNPLSIVIPCHRVIGSNGKLTGFAGGLEKKKFLLDLEREFNTL